MGGAVSFLRPVGPAADVKELEYITSLHQAIEPRNDGSIIDQDIKVFLKSRYGIVVTTEEVREIILQGLQADVVEADEKNENEAVLDVMEVASILLIPLLKKSRELAEGRKLPEGVEEPPHGIIATVLERILQDVLGSEFDEDNPPELTIDLLRRIFQAYGEDGIAQNKALLREMVACCRDEFGHGHGHGHSRIPLNKKSLAIGLTYDVDALDISNENRKTTSKDDVFLSYFVPKGRHAETIIGVDLEATHVKAKQAVAEDVETDFTFASIDLAASTYRSKSLMVFLYATVLITYFAYFQQLPNDWLDCEDLGYGFNYSSTPWVDNVGPTVCTIGAQVTRWLFFFLFLCFFGVASVVCASIGNDVYCEEARWPALGMFTVMLLTVVPFAFTLVTDNDASEPTAAPVAVADSEASEPTAAPVAVADSETSPHIVFLRYMSLVLGLIVCALHLSHIISLSVSESSFSWLRKAFNPSALYSEYSMKKAVSHKLNNMAKNALDLLEKDIEKDLVVTSNFGRGLFAFSQFGSRLEPAGGIMWTLRGARSKVLYRDEGIWYSARILASNICQYILTLFLIAGGFALAAYVADNYSQQDIQEIVAESIDFLFNKNLTGLASDNVTSLVADWVTTNDSLEPSCSTIGADFVNQYCQTDANGVVTCQQPSNGDDLLCGFVGGDPLTPAQQSALLDAAGFSSEELKSTARQSLEQAAADAVTSLYPQEQYMSTVPLIIGVLIAFFVSLNLAISFVPSVTSTILKLRCGVLPLKESPLLAQYRVAPESVAILIGSLFWGTLASSVITGGVWGLVLFFFLWQATAYFAQRLIAVFIGIMVIFLIRYCALVIFRIKYFQGFYRTRPAAANVTTLALEWSSFALSTGFIFIRMVKLLFITGFSIGRIDKPLLAPGIGRIGPIDLDNLDGYPTVFMRDVLIHEAHRHPYLELLGTMYLYKLRYAESFGSTAGSCWRLLFVYGLMPWLHQYRIQTRSRLDEVVFPDFDRTNFGSVGTTETRTLIANTRAGLGLGGGRDRTAASPWGQGPSQTFVPLGQSNSRNLRSEEEDAYKDEIQQLKKKVAELNKFKTQTVEVEKLKNEKLKTQTAEVEKLKNDMAEYEKLKKEHAELKGILAALEQPSVVEPQPRPQTPSRASASESRRLQPEPGRSARSPGRQSARLDP